MWSIINSKAFVFYYLDYFNYSKSFNYSEK